MKTLDQAIRAGVQGNTPSRNGAEAEAGPLFDPTAIRFDRFLLTAPPPREWILTNVLPAGIISLLAGMGGSGKSYLLWQFLMSVCLGRPFVGFNVGSPGAVLYLASEEDEDELHRRGRSVLWKLTDGDPNARGLAKVVGDHLHVMSLRGRNNLLTSARDGDVAATPLVQSIIDAASKIPHLRQIVLDPVSRFRGGKANVEEDTTPFVAVCEAISTATGAGVMLAAHVSQAGIKEGGGQEIVRGSTALVDGVRWVATLQRMKRALAETYGLDSPEEADQYLRFEIPKNNYAPAFGGMWLKRDPDGLFDRTELTNVRVTKQEQKADATYDLVLPRLRKLLLDNGAMTRRKLRDYSGTNNVLAVGEKAVRGIVNVALERKDLFERDGVVYATQPAVTLTLPAEPKPAKKQKPVVRRPPSKRRKP